MTKLLTVNCVLAFTPSISPKAEQNKVVISSFLVRQSLFIEIRSRVQKLIKRNGVLGYHLLDYAHIVLICILTKVHAKNVNSNHFLNQQHGNNRISTLFTTVPHKQIQNSLKTSIHHCAILKKKNWKRGHKYFLEIMHTPLNYPKSETEYIDNEIFTMLILFCRISFDENELYFHWSALQMNILGPDNNLK